jgi:hypothetical protein
VSEPWQRKRGQHRLRDSSMRAHRSHCT